jgi:hypothetical protein
VTVRRGRLPVAVPDRFAAVLGNYAKQLAEAPLSAQTRPTYAYRRCASSWSGSTATRPPATRSASGARGTGRCATTAPTCSRWPSVSRPR